MIKTFIKDGIEYETIDGLDIPWPKRPNKNQIANHDKPKAKQKFYKSEIPDSFKRIARDQFGNPIYTADQNSFIDEELTRIHNGYWFYNNGTPTYITGYHYAELNRWKIDVGLKEYRDRDRRVHLHWQFCENDPDCFGQIYMKHRRDGATHRANCINYFRTIGHRDSHSGIQSKSGSDASQVFKKLVTAWRKLPAYLQPIHEGNTFPKKALNFFEPSERIGKNNRRVKQSEALESWIDYLPTQSEAYDGQKLLFYHGDEWGKTVDAKVSETWMIVRECLTLGNKIVGKACITSTVAEMEKKGGKEFKKIWDQSDPRKRDANGRTLSGLYRLFLPAFDGLEGFIDEYGYSVIETPTQEQRIYLSKISGRDPSKVIGAKQYLLNRREEYRKQGDQTGLSEYKRLYPFNEKEALAGAAKFCEFDLEKIETQLEKFTYGNDLVRRVNFEWENVDGISRDTRVYWKENKNGRFLISWAPESKAETNLVEVVGQRADLLEGTNQTYTRNIYKPANNLKFCIGIDPFDHDVTVTGTGSNAAAYVFKKYDMMEKDDMFNGVFVVQYLCRPKLAKIFYEDMIKLCVFFGCEMLYETQKPRIKDYFETRGYEHFLMLKPKVSDGKFLKQITANDVAIGQAASKNTIQQISEYWQEYIDSSCHKIPFPELLEDLRDFDVSDTEKSDATMGGGYTLIASRKKFREKPKESKMGIFFPTYNNSGSVSILNEN